LFSAGAWIQSGPYINLVKTVGTDPGTCATSSSIDIEIGTPVTYCYRVTNTGAVTFTLHDLDDSEFGPILSGFNFSLVPGASAFLTQTAVVTQTTVNTATWTAYNAGPTDVVSDTALATVTVVPPSINLAKTVGTDAGLCSSDNSITVAISTTVYYCYRVTNTGQTTLALHDLDDSELGPILSGFNFSLVPGASAFLTQTAVITQTTVNTATWTAYNAGPTDVVSDTDSATVTIFFVPQIEVNPDILSGTQPLNTQVNQTLTISNVGTGDLDWAIDEAEPVNAVASSGMPQSILTSTADEAINLVSELGMSLPAGLSPVSQAGGVVDCDAEPGIIIHDDGTIENGYSGNPATGITEVRFVDRFTPSSYPTSFKAVCIAFISLGPTSLNFDIVVYDDDGPGSTPGTQLGSLSATAVTPVISPPIPPDYQPTWNSYDISSMGISIESGNAYIGVRYAPSAPNVFIAADQSTGNPVGYAGGYWWNNNSSAWTTIQTGFVSYRSLFVRPVEGEPTACDLPSDIPWVSVDPTSGTIAEGASSEVTVTYDSTGLSTGVYTGTLCVNSNDGNNPLVTVPLTLTVVPNIAPAAADDAYATAQGATLTVAAPGVLANDSDDDGDALTAVLDTGPSNGSLILNSDGSFTYTPTVGFMGTDIFTYYANDGLQDSNVATVTVMVGQSKIYLPVIIMNANTQAGVGASENVAASHDGWAFPSLAALPIMLGILLPYWRYQRR
jgi:hypothetical protein